MPVQWCAHPMSHWNETRIGSRPTHPRGDRKVDEELARFINNSLQLSTYQNMNLIQQGEFLCRTCYEKERNALQLSTISNEDLETEHESMDIDELMPTKRRSTTYTLNQTLNIRFGSEKGDVSSDSESSINNEADETEQLFHQMKAKRLLNDVFAVLGIPSVSDM